MPAVALSAYLPPPAPCPPQVVNQIFMCQEVEEAFEKMAAGDKGAMKVGQRDVQAARCPVHRRLA